MTYRSKMEDTARVLYDEPLSFDPSIHLPPYLRWASALRTASLARRASSGIPDLVNILVSLRAMAHVYHTFHWQTSGPLFYADHLLFERLYESTAEEIDAVGEQITSLYGVRGVDPSVHARLVSREVEQILSFPGSQVLKCLGMENHFLHLLSELSEKNPPLGVDNLLGEMATTHMSHQYLLSQRNK